MFNLAGMLAVALTSARFDTPALRRIAVSAAVLVVVVPLAYALVIAVGPSRAGMPVRVSWPQAEISERLAAVWARETGRPLGIVAGDDWMAGLVGITAKDRPSILSHGDLALSPWITPERIARRGHADRLGGAQPKRIPAARWSRLVAARPAGEERFKWRAVEGPRRSGDRLHHRAAETVCVIANLPSTPPRQ